MRLWSLILATILLALIIQLLIVRASPGAAPDMQAYQLQAYAALHHINIYNFTSRYPYPPVWIWIVYLMKELSTSCHIPFDIAIRLPIILSESLMAIPLALWGYRRNPSFWNLCIIMILGVLNPLNILVSAFHGQFDAIALLLLSIALYVEDVKQSCSTSTLTLGFAIALKGWPILFFPIIFFRRKNLRAKLTTALITLAPTLLSMVIYTALVGYSPRMLFNIIGYSSTFDFGWASLLKIYIYDLNFITQIAHIDIVLIGVTAFFIGRRFHSDVVRAATMVLVITYGLAIKMSIQYLSWMCAALPLAPKRLSIPMLSIGSFTAAAYYFGVLFRPLQFNVLVSDIAFHFGQTCAVVFTLSSVFLMIRMLRMDDSAWKVQSPHFAKLQPSSSINDSNG